jgi:hypothetical protein
MSRRASLHWRLFVYPHGSFEIARVLVRLDSNRSGSRLSLDKCGPLQIHSDTNHGMNRSIFYVIGVIVVVVILLKLLGVF